MPLPKVGPSNGGRRTVRSYRRLLHLIERVIEDPEALRIEPAEQAHLGAAERRLLDGIRRLVERLEVGQQELRASDERFQLAVDGSNDGLWDWNLETNAIYFSPRWKQMLGYKDHELANDFEEWSRRIHPEDRERAFGAIQAFLDGITDHYELEHRLLHRDGSYRWISARGTCLRDANGRVYRMAGSQTDVTERHQAQEALGEREAQYRSIFETTTDGLVINDFQTGRLVEANPAFCRMHGYTREELLGRHPSLFIHPDSLHLFEEFIETVRQGREFSCQAVDLRKDGSLLHVEIGGTGISYGGRPCVLGVVRDVSDRVQAYQKLEQRVQERTRELATLLDLSNIVGSTLELKPLLGLILNQLRRVVDYTGSSLLTLEGRDLVVVEARGASAADSSAVGLRFPLEEGTPIVDLLDLRRPVIVADVRDASPLAEAYRGAVGSLMDTDAFSYVRSWLAAPMLLNDQVTGILSLAHARPNFYSAQHARLAGAIANQAAVAIENARLYGQAQSLAVVEERQRLARELHDSVTQSLFSMTMISGALPRLLARDPARALERTERLHELSQGALAEMRALIFELHPESLEREGLAVALEKQAAAVRARHGIRVETDLTAELDATLEVQEALFRIAQEAMNNAVKHARAHRLIVRLRQDGATMVLDVEDDGVGFDPSGRFPGHFGHRSMRERAQALGGTLSIDSALGEGAHIRASIPSAGA
ncbi:MAG: PAS domain S-box protein [Dehalococcoidia bacterium]